jgi:hypothetical protein
VKPRRLAVFLDRSGRARLGRRGSSNYSLSSRTPALTGNPVRSALLLGLALLGFAIQAAPAAAAQHQIGEIKAPGAVGFTELKSESVAVDDHNGHILVADSGNGTVYDYSSLADTAPEEWAGFGGGNLAVAVEQSSGDVYVADKVDKTILKLDEEGNPVASFGTAGAIDGSSTPAGSFSPAAEGTFGIAVDQATGDLYAIDAGHEVIDVFNATGAYNEQITAKPGELYGGGAAYTDGIAVDEKSGQLLVSTSWDLKTYRFALSGATVAPALGPFGSGYTSVAADSETGDIYITDTTDSLVERLNSAAEHQDQIAGLPGGSFGGLAVDPAGGDLYVSDGSSETVKVFGAPIPPKLLQVTKTGGGYGRLTSAPAGINCGATCSAELEDGSSVTLTATPPSGSTFVGWSGACSGVASCQVTMSEARTVSAEFTFVGILPGTCPNETLRHESLLNPESGLPFSTQLPDCRAYELTTPAFKQGTGLGVVAVSPDGSSQIVGGHSFAGTGSTVVLSYYRISRGENGWVVSSISPSAGQFPATRLVASSADLDQTLWKTRSGGQALSAVNLSLRNQSGAFVSVGPMVPPAGSIGSPGGNYPNFTNLQFNYAGASATLSHVLFAAKHGEGVTLWPGDTTAENGVGGFRGFSLYEYVGTENEEPKLVGVSDGSTMRGASPIPAGTLVSSCSTWLGSDEGGDTYNAVSEEGKTVFFTARGQNNRECQNPDAPEVNELYARVDGSQTIPISEPTLADCAGCIVAPDEAHGRRAGEFRGASRDGSKVFFETEQELLPGAEGKNLYEFDFDAPAGERIILVSAGPGRAEVQGVARVSEDGSHVYFVAKGILTSGPNPEGAEPIEGADNLYAYEQDSAHPGGNVTFVATLAEQDERDWHGVDQRPVQATPDGRYLVFSSAADITPGDTSTKAQVFEYDSQTEELVRVSVGQSGFAAGPEHADRTSAFTGEQAYTSDEFRPSESTAGINISADGSVVVFSTIAALTPAAEAAELAGAPSAYEYRSSGAISHGEIGLISSGVNQNGGRLDHFDAPPYVAGYGPRSGSDIFFNSSDALVGQDGDTGPDIYDAREGGGFARPSSLLPCVGEPGCRPPAVAPGAEAVPGSASNVFTGPANPIPHRRKHKKSRRKHQKHHRSHGKHRRGPGAKKVRTANRYLGGVR